MNSKERVIKAIRRENPDRIPRYLNWYAKQTLAKYGAKIDSLTEQYTDDILLATLDRPASFAAQTEDIMEEWGVVRRHAEGGVGVHRVASKLDNLDYLDEYLERDFPDPKAPGRFDRAKRVRDQNPDKYVLGHWWKALLETVYELRGMENFFIDLLLNKDKIMKLERALTDYWKEIIRGFADVGVDGIFFSDDVGDQRNLMISPQLWREIFNPLYKEMFDEAHKYGLHVFMHSCGNITSILPDLIEIGLDVIHPIQPGTMDAVSVVEKYGKDITFFGSIDVQHLLPEGSPDEVEEGIKRMIEIFDDHSGGFIITTANSIMPETPLVNIEMMYKAVEKYSVRR